MLQQFSVMELDKTGMPPTEVRQVMIQVLETWKSIRQTSYVSSKLPYLFGSF